MIKIPEDFLACNSTVFKAITVPLSWDHFVFLPLSFLTCSLHFALSGGGVVHIQSSPTSWSPFSFCAIAFCLGTNKFRRMCANMIPVIFDPETQPIGPEIVFVSLWPSRVSLCLRLDAVMYPSGNANNPPPNYSYYNTQSQYGSPPLGKRSPPPLQHPIPQHPIPNFSQTVHHGSPSPGLPQQQQQQQQNNSFHYHQPQYVPNNIYSQFGFSDPATHLGMQFAGSAVAQGTAYMERNVRNSVRTWGKKMKEGVS